MGRGSTFLQRLGAGVRSGPAEPGLRSARRSRGAITGGPSPRPPLPRRLSQLPAPLTRGLAPALLASLLLVPPPVFAHARLARSQPAARAQLAQAPPRVYLWFSEPIEARFSTVTVEGPGGGRVDRGDPRVDSDDPTRLSVGLPALAPASYVIRYRVLSVDGHVVEGEIPFAVRPAP